MRHSITLACAAVIGLIASTERAEALAVVDDYSYPDLQQTPNESLDPRLRTFIDLKDVQGRIRSAAEDAGGPAAGTFPVIDFGPDLHFGATEPVLEYRRIWGPSSNDPTPFARYGFTMDVTDVTASDGSSTPTPSLPNPADTKNVDETVITDLTTESITVAEGFLYAGDFQQRMQLNDRETVTDLLKSAESTLLSGIGRSTNINDLAVVPLPGSVYMLLSALAVFGWLARKRLLAKRRESTRSRPSQAT